MDEKKKTAMLGTLKRAFDTHPQAYKDYKKLGEAVLDCAEFIQEKALASQSKALAKSRLSIEVMLLEENLPSLLEDFRTVTGIIDQIQQLQSESTKEISDVILITSEFLLAMEEVEYPEEK
jgi:NifB/MoaA-like Fe-S oxidoreductase